MGDRFEQLKDEHIEFIEAQQLFFVGTAAADGRVNVSPKGMDSLRVRDAQRVAWLNLTGSGNETATHVQQSPRMTLMFCSFGKQPQILRLYGSAVVTHAFDEEWSQALADFPDYVGARQVFELQVDLVQESCGFAVPRYELVGERPTLDKWALQKGRDGIEAYWEERNTLSLDGKDTGIIK